MSGSFTTLFDHQLAAFESAPAPTAQDRLDRLGRLRALLMHHRPAIRKALHADFRKPPQEVDATEIAPVVIEIDHAIRNLRDWMKPRSHRAPTFLAGTTWETRYEPVGPSLILAPWNYPITLTLGPLVHAIAAGCPVFVKPSEHTSATAALIQNMVSDLLGPEDAVVVQGGPDVAQRLLELPFRHVHFTGSPRVGRLVMQAAAAHPASVTLELGGKTPAVVDGTADLALAASRIVYGKFANAGQTCIAPDHVLVHRDVFTDFLGALVNEISTRYGETAKDRHATPDLARIVTPEHFERQVRLLDDATRLGARTAFGGGHDSADRYVEPTLLVNVPDDARVMQEEIFGPILPIVTYASFEGMLERIRSAQHPLSAYVFSKDDDLARALGARIRTGAICQNETLLHFVNPEVGFGGIGTSGIGRSHGHAGFQAFSNEQTLMRRRFGAGIVERLYPPYSSRTTKLVDWLMRLS
ncbi:MAG: aldehyde dehydrogenase family protein [Rhodothermales bacterium]